MKVKILLFILLIGITTLFFNKLISTRLEVRYFISSVIMVENRYAPMLIKCLSDNEGKEIYRQWSAIYYPTEPPYQVALLRVILQNAKRKYLDSSCFIAEIKSKNEWKDIKAKYNFQKEDFGAYEKRKNN